MSTPDAILEIKGLAIAFGGLKAVQDFSLALLNRNEFVYVP